MVVKQITWPHELVYGADGKPAIYEELTLPLFISEYLSVLDTLKSRGESMILKHLKELMVDAELYGYTVSGRPGFSARYKAKPHVPSQGFHRLL